MSEMIERVAKAILAEGFGYETDREKIARQLARAAIEAMREATAAMEAAAFQKAQDETLHTNGEFVADHSVWPMFIRSTVLWRAMIDAALSEKDG